MKFVSHINHVIALCSGTNHLKQELIQNNFEVFTLGYNYDGKRFFPNRDLYTRLDEVTSLEGKKVIVLQSGSGSGEYEQEVFSSADRVLEVLQLLSILNRPVKVNEIKHKQYKRETLPSPKDVSVIYTCHPFTLQDGSFKTGEANVAQLILELTLQNATKVGVIDLHSPPDIPWVKKAVNSGKLVCVSAASRLVDEATKRFNLKEPIVVAPDEGGQRRIGIPGFIKKRLDSYTVLLEGGIAVKDRDVVLIDDLTKSGSTLIKARNQLLEQGANRVVSCVTHVLPLIKGEELLQELVKRLNGKILVSNTVPTKTFLRDYSHLVVSCIPEILSLIQNV